MCVFVGVRCGVVSPLRPLALRLLGRLAVSDVGCLLTRVWTDSLTVLTSAHEACVVRAQAARTLCDIAAVRGTQAVTWEVWREAHTGARADATQDVSISCWFVPEATHPWWHVHVRAQAHGACVFVCVSHRWHVIALSLTQVFEATHSCSYAHSRLDCKAHLASVTRNLLCMCVYMCVRVTGRHAHRSDGGHLTR